MDFQLFLIVILVFLALSLSAASVYAILVLKELKQSIHKFNTLIEDTAHFKDNFLNPANTVVGVVGTVVEALKAVKSVRSIADFDEQE